MPRVARMADRGLRSEEATRNDVFADAHEALIALGHTSAEARKLIETATAGGKKFKSVEDLLTEIYKRAKE
jgi:Holliday junction DNA helicase RuvA